MKNTITLNGAWDLYYQDGVSGDRLTLQKRDAAKKIEGRVPGNADLDLSRAGILPEDLYKGMNTVEAYRTETWDYLYERSFDFAGCGATVPLTGFGYLLARGTLTGIRESGAIGALTGGLGAASAGICAAMVFSLAAALLFRGKPNNL